MAHSAGKVNLSAVLLVVLLLLVAIAAAAAAGQCRLMLI
jgi:hypothetical protein